MTADDTDERRHDDEGAGEPGSGATGDTGRTPLPDEDPLDRIEPHPDASAEDAADVDRAWEETEPAEGEAPTG